MPFKKILVALDGSQNSQIAAEYAFWLASSLDATLTGQHVVDPRLVDLFVEREFAETLGFAHTLDASDKVFFALRKIGKVILDLFATQAAGRGLKASTVLSEGYICEEIIKCAEKFDLLVIGHRGKLRKQLPSQIMLGSVAERVAFAADMPVLITVQRPEHIQQILVAYDGSEPARGALLMAEHLAKKSNCPLKAMVVVPSSDEKERAKFLVEEGKTYLREYSPEDVFSIKQGAIASTLLEQAGATNSLLVLGAYGFRELDKNVLGSTTTKVIRESKTSVLVYKPNVTKAKRKEETAFAKATR